MESRDSGAGVARTCKQMETAMSSPRKDATNGTTTSRPTAGSVPATTDLDVTRNGRGQNAPTQPRALTDAFTDERDDVLAVINELEDQLDRNEQIRETLEREIARLNEQSQTSAQRIQELEWQTVTLQTNVDTLTQVRQENSLIEEELADANARAQRVAEQLARSEKEAARLTEELKTATKQNEELWAVRKERDGLRTDLKNLRSRLETTERSNREVVEERTGLQTKLQEAQIQLEDARGERNQIELSLRAAEDRNFELRQAIDAIEQKLEDSRTERKGLQAQVTRLERENARLVEQQQFYEVEIASLRNLNRTSESTLNNMKKAFSEVRIALTETKARARRRSIENLPRVAASLRGLEDASAESDRMAGALSEGAETANGD
ncbi:MAG: hypothetical protein AMXMBFR47_07800 [Planctomycetota bacterium]